MQTGDIILIPFPFAELTNIKVRPAVIVTITNDTHRDIVICAVSSVIPSSLSDTEFIVLPGGDNSLRVRSVVKVDRIVTLKQQNVIARLGKLHANQLQMFKKKFKALVD